METTAALLPTISHTWVEPSQVSVGWLAWTRSGLEAAADRAGAWDVFSRLADLLPGPSNLNSRSQWYQRSFARDDGAATVYYDGVGRARGSLMVSVRQSWFEQAGDLVDQLAGLVGDGHVSRLDLAADDTAPDRSSPRNLYDLLPTARSRSRLAHRSLTLTGDGGQKLTIGSRASARYARIYVKGDRVRHEIELKQDAAGAAWGALVAGSAVAETWAREYGRLVAWR